MPSGFILKRDAKKLADEKKAIMDQFTLEDLIEKERAALSSQNLTKVTLESFMGWKKRKLIEKKNALKKDQDKKLKEFKAGNKIGVSVLLIVILTLVDCILIGVIFTTLQLSGRDMFTFNPELANEANMYEGDEDGVSYAPGDDDDEDGGDDQIVTNDLSDANFYNEYFKIGEGEEEDGASAVVPDVSRVKISEDGAGPSVPIDEELFDDELFDDDDEEVD